MRRSLVVKKCFALILTLAVVMSCTMPAMAAGFPVGATNKVVTVESGLNAGTYIANDGWSASTPYSKTLEESRVTIPNYHYYDEWDEYVFDPDNYVAIEWHEDGFPMRAGYRTVVDYMGEMKYLAQTYPEITKLSIIGYSWGIKDDAVALNGVSNDNVDPERSIPIYALEICNNPGEMDGRPATLHQAGNHGGELDANEMCMNLAWYLCTQYGKDEEVTELLDTTRVYLLPYTNPDGNIINFRDRSNINPAARTNARGVDPNRNWAYRWGSNNGSLSNLGSTHRGRGPNSEPETQAISSLYRNDNIISSISGHTSGQIIIFAWAFLRNTTDGHPLLTQLAKEQADLNGHTPQNGNVMYAQSGEINDYLWGSMRALGFTFEYSDSQVQSYLGYEDGDPYITASYLNAAGNPKEMRTSYSSVEGSGMPSKDVTAQLAFLDDEWISLGYQDLTAEEEGNGLSKDPDEPDSVGPLLNRISVEKIQAAITANPDFVKGKIFLSHVPESAEIGNEIAALLKANGAVGWIVTGTSTNGGYSQPRINYGADGLPVAGLLKGYAADVFQKAVEDPTITVTLKSTMADLHSLYYEWSRQKPAYMANMSYAREYANQLKGTIMDENGNKIDATLEASLVIEGKIIDVDSNYGNSDVVIERSYDEQWKEIQRTHYDVEGGDYTWYMLPSKQSEYADKGWTITAKTPGRYTETVNVKFPVDSENAIKHEKDPVVYADPLFQQVITDVNFTLPKAFEVDQDLNALLGTGGTITITTYNRDGAVADVPGVYVEVNGEEIYVRPLGNGKYSAMIPAAAKDISVGCAGAEEETASSSNNDDVALVYALKEKASLELTTDVDTLSAGDTFGLNTAFVEEVYTDSVRLTYTYNPELFEVNLEESLANFEKAGYSVLDSHVDETGGQVQVTLTKNDDESGYKEFYPFTLKKVQHTALGDNGESYSDDPSSPSYSEYYVGDRKEGSTKVTFNYLDEVGEDMVFTAKADVGSHADYQTISVVAKYIEDGAETEKISHAATVTFTTYGEKVQ